MRYCGTATTVIASQAEQQREHPLSQDADGWDGPDLFRGMPRPGRWYTRRYLG